MEAKQPTREQRKEFWERCGLVWGIGGGWFDSTRKYLGDNLYIDLNNLFKYAIPVLKREYHNWKSVLHDWVDSLTGDYEKDSLLLFAQTYGRIKGKQGDTSCQRESTKE